MDSKNEENPLGYVLAFFSDRSHRDQQKTKITNNSMKSCGSTLKIITSK